MNTIQKLGLDLKPGNVVKLSGGWAILTEVGKEIYFNLQFVTLKGTFTKDGRKTTAALPANSFFEVQIP